MNIKPTTIAVAAAAASMMARKEPGLEEGTDAPIQDEEIRKAKLLPKPTGWRLLCAVPEAEKTHSGTGIIKAEESISVEQQTTVVLFVLEVGPDAYGDKEKFPNGPWCQKGDFVLVRAYAGTRFKIFGKEFRILNDDQIDAVVEDPRGLSRA
jgi:co-chaperonin GroES (HSP10)